MKAKEKKEPVRKIYKKLPKKFYSPKYKCWVIRENIKDGKWIGYKFLNEKTKEKIEEIFDEHSVARLNKRIVEYINNPNIF